MNCRIWFVGSIISILTACGGSSGGDGGGTPTLPPVANLTKVGGSWSGQTTTDGIAGFEQVRGVISERGDGVIFSIGAVYVITSVSGIDGNATLTFTGYTEQGYEFSDGSTVSAGTFEGVVVERESITGSWSTDSGDSGSLSIEYHPGYDIDSSILILAGIYSNDYDGTVVIDPDGSFFMQDLNGCTLNGVAGEIDTDYNLYDMSFDITNCGTANSHVTGYVAHFETGNNERIEVIGASDLGFIYYASFFQFN